ncbi:MAG: ABC transporter ATP-binding protein [Candidatus Zixiibacteriota bacterium]|nr:MAG: ABC transporter ATP-binding protein [candidate division Zixibacteria bacterium]
MASESYLSLLACVYSLTVDRVSKRFGARKVFADVSFSLQTGEALAIVGPNGSGKTTLVLLLLGQYHLLKGTITYARDGAKLPEEELRRRTALVSPYLNLYDHLTAEENLIFLSTVAGGSVSGREVDDLLASVGLEGRGHDLVGAYSSGMKQRLKYAAALMKKPDFLFLDEPTSNLDEAGKQIVFDLIRDYRRKAVVIIATNEPKEQELADHVCRVA